MKVEDEQKNLKFEKTASLEEDNLEQKSSGPTDEVLTRQDSLMSRKKDLYY